MTIDEARFKVLEQNIQALQQTCFQVLIRLTDLKIVLAGKGLLTHPEEKGDIPEHSLFAQVKLFLEKEGFEEPVVHTSPRETCKLCKDLFDTELATKRSRIPPGCTGDYYGAL